jgi:oligoribonuclease
MRRLPMAANPDNLLWVDMEMSGLNPDTDRVLEVAIVITDSQLNTVDSWNKGTHSKSGLIDRVKASALDEATVEQRMVGFLSAHVPPGISPMCGNTVHQDRRFMARHLPALEAFFHYRNLDVSTLKELMKRWRPDLAAGFVKHGKHEALADIYESIDELKYYREHFLKV